MRSLFWLFVIATLLAMLGCATTTGAPPILCSPEQTDAFFTSVTQEDSGVEIIDFLADDFEQTNRCSLGTPSAVAKEQNRLYR